MKVTIVILSLAAGLMLALSLSDTAQARDAQGAFLYNTNSIDPTEPPRGRVQRPEVPDHKHDFSEFGTRKANPDDPQCCASIPRIDFLGCRGCNSELRFGRDGRLDRTRTYRAPR